MSSEKKPDKLFYRMPTEEIDLVTDIRSSILAQHPRGTRVILWTVLILFFAGLYWASISEIEEVTRGQGKVIPASQIQLVQNMEGGIISEILVKVGDTVAKDQLLLKIDDTRFSSSFQQNRAKYLANRAKAARLQAETSGNPFMVPADVMKEIPDIGRRERELYESRKNELNSSIHIKQEQIKQRNQELKEVNSKLADLTKTYEIFQKEINLTRPLVAQGAVSDVELLRLERQASEMRGDMEANRQAIPRLQSKIEESNVALKELRLTFINKAKAELNEVSRELGEDAASSVALKDRLTRTMVRSPVNGTVNRILVNTVGGVVQPGMNLVEIVPTEGTLLIEAKISPRDIAFLRPNQPATVKFTAYDFTIYGGLEARLEQISADSITDEKGNSHFLVYLRTDRNYLGTKDNPLPIIPGMIASVDIQTGKKTVLSYLIKPIMRARYMALRER